jgi:hypothetical protein
MSSFSAEILPSSPCEKIARTNLGLNGPFYRMMSSSNNLELKPEDLNNPSIESFENLILKIS